MIDVIKLANAGKGNFQSNVPKSMEIFWFIIEACLINNRLIPFSWIRVVLLRLFGAKLGHGCRLLHAIRVKAPWNLEVGDNCWFGESVWIYNQELISIGSNVCISQGTFLSAGSHDVTTSMNLRVAPIVIEDGVWISSMCVIQMGVTIGRSAVVTPLSVVYKSLAPGSIYGGNPCKFIRFRFNR